MDHNNRLQTFWYIFFYPTRARKVARRLAIGLIGLHLKDRLLLVTVKPGGENWVDNIHRVISVWAWYHRQPRL